MRQADEHGGAVPGAERDHRSANFVGRRITEHAAEEASYSRALREAEIEKAAAKGTLRQYIRDNSLRTGLHISQRND